MTIKQKFSSIDQSKLTADQKAFLTKIKDVTKNFTDAEMNKKVEAPLDGFIAKAKEKMPEAIKSAPVRRTSTKAKSSQTRKPKRTAMSLAKEIRKEGESWNDARARASKMMKEDSKDLSKTVETELDKLTKLVRSQKSKAKLTGISGTNLKRDASRKAKPRGSRTVTHSGETSNQYGTFSNKLGRKYYESRDRHSDRLAPNYPKNAPYLADGGYLTDPNFGNFQNTMFNKGGSVTNERRYVNKGEDYEVRYSRPILRRKGYQGKRDFELGGTMATDLAGHTGGGDAGLNAGMPLDGFSNTGYTGLVGETGAMSSGEMFMAGGKVDKNFNLAGYKKYRMFDDFKDAKDHVDMDRKKYPYGKESVVIKNGKYYEVWSEPVTGKITGERVYEVGGGLKFGNLGENRSTKFIDKNFEVIVYPEKLEILIIITNEDTINQEGLDASGVKWREEDFGYSIEADNKTEFNKAIKVILGVNKRFADGGGLPSGVEQSYMITESLGNPAQHFATGGGVRIHNGREYSIGRNWTNDFRHVNKAEEHEVTYNRKGKFLGIFKDGGAIKNQYEGRTSEDVWNNWTVSQKEHFVTDHFAVLSLTKPQFSEWIEDFTKNAKDNDKYDSLAPILKKYIDYHISEGQYNKGGSVTNERRYVNKGEDYEVRYSKPILRRKGYQGKRDFMAGGSMETPRIYVADLEAYNNGRLVGEWLDLADYNDADELMDAIQDVLKKSGGEEYAIHDVEYIPSSMYSEYMGKRDFEELYEMIDLAKQNDLPLEVVQEIVSQYSASAVDDFVGKYDSAVDFAEQMVDDMGIESFNDFEYYLDISEIDRRLLSQEMADSYVEDIRDEDGGNRLIEEAGLNVDEYEDASDETKEEMLDLASSMVNDEYYDTWYEGLNDPKGFLVDEQGMYSVEDFAKANFVRVDYDRLADALEQDYTFIEHDGDLYVFNIR